MRKKRESLAATDVGRVTVDGAIERIEHTTGGTVVRLESGMVLALGEGDTVAFVKPPRAAEIPTR